MNVGTISKISHDRQYGEICTDSGEVAHFHKECLWGIQFAQLVQGQAVEFEMQPSNKGYLAFHIRLN